MRARACCPICGGAAPRHFCTKMGQMLARCFLRGEMPQAVERLRTFWAAAVGSLPLEHPPRLRYLLLKANTPRNEKGPGSDNYQGLDLGVCADAYQSNQPQPPPPRPRWVKNAAPPNDWSTRVNTDPGCCCLPARPGWCGLHGAIPCPGPRTFPPQPSPVTFPSPGRPSAIGAASTA